MVGSLTPIIIGIPAITIVSSHTNVHLPLVIYELVGQGSSNKLRQSGVRAMEPCTTWLGKRQSLGQSSVAPLALQLDFIAHLMRCRLRGMRVTH